MLTKISKLTFTKKIENDFGPAGRGARVSYIKRKKAFLKNIVFQMKVEITIRGTGRLTFSSSHKYLISENFKESSALQVGF